MAWLLVLTIMNYKSINNLTNTSDRVHNPSESLSQIQKKTEFDYTLFIRNSTYFVCFVAYLTFDAAESTSKNTFLQ